MIKTKHSFKIYKQTVNHEFTIEIEELDKSLSIKVDGIGASYIESNHTLDMYGSKRFGKQTIGAISISDRNDIIEIIEKGYARIRKQNKIEQQEREKDRPAPTLDQNKFFTYSLGCDTGLIYPESHRKVIRNILNSGVKPQPVLRGSRDDSRKFPGTYDGMIPVEYVKVSKKKEILKYEGYPDQVMEYNEYSADGYKSVWCEDVFALPNELVEKEKIRYEQEIDKLKQEQKQKAETKRQEIFNTARQTNTKQVLERWSEECDDSAEECDIDNIVTYAMPDGSTKTERNHTW